MTEKDETKEELPGEEKIFEKHIAGIIKASEQHAIITLEKNVFSFLCEFATKKNIDLCEILTERSGKTVYIAPEFCQIWLFTEEVMEVFATAKKPKDPPLLQ